MSLVINKNYSSPNHDPIVISPKFLVLHYTAANLTGTLQVFQNPGSKASSHLVIDTTGEVYELVPCLSRQCLKAWHAGDSRWVESSENSPKTWKKFNDFSIGIELVNKNGNLFPYTQAQYHSLSLILQQLKSCYPSLNKPQRILGHEHIAGYRGKVDPGHHFDWCLFFSQAYPQLSKDQILMCVNKRLPVLPPDIQKKFHRLSAPLIKETKGSTHQDWQSFNQEMEQATLQQISQPPPSNRTQQ